jgi:hypothetical protein
MAKDPSLCKDCQSAPAEYMITVTGLKSVTGRCARCHERAVCMGVSNKKSTITKRRRVSGHGYNGGDGYAPIY